jgi:sugar/nucleoside kinase (ribokinase family)
VVLGGQGALLTPADLEPILPHVDLICGGPLELRRATRRADSQDAARALIGLGARAVLAKRGPEGAAVFRPGPATLEREDASTPTAALQLPAMHPVRQAAVFGAVFDAAYLLGVALNDASPIRFAANAALRTARSDSGVMGT